MSEPTPREEITLLYPNDTTVKISGDGEVIKQILHWLDNKVVYFEKQRYGGKEQ